MVGVPLVPDMVQPAEVGAVARHYSVPLGGRKQATKLCPPPQVLVSTFVLDPSPHREEA
jgi:hypothetical protein